MLGFIDISECSSSEPGYGGTLSPYCNLKSLYFDDSLYENKLHYRINELIDELPGEYEGEEFHIKCNNEIEYNDVLDKLFKYGEDKIKMYGVSNAPFEIIIDDDPRKNYRQFDEEKFLMKEEDVIGK